MKINDWNMSIDYANVVCNNLKMKGFNVKQVPYVMYDGTKGIYFQLFDNQNNFFEQYASGINSSFIEMKSAIDCVERRIIEDVQ